MSINTQSQFQDDNKKHERGGVFILELQIGKTYILTEDEKRDSTGTVFIKKGSRVLVKNLGSSLALVQDLSAHKNSDGIWSVKIDKLVTEEEYAAMQEADDAAAGVEPIQLKRGAIYVMKEAETSVDGTRTFLEKGTKVRLSVIGDSRVLVEELSEDALAGGLWITSADKLVTEEEYAAELEVKNKHYVSDHQPIETMQSNMTHDEMIGFLKGNIIKYACRCGKKDEPLKEAEKIKQYAEWLCIVLSGGTINPRS